MEFAARNPRRYGGVVGLQRMEAAVTLRRYPGMGHTIDPEEMAYARAMVDAITDDLKLHQASP